MTRPVALGCVAAMVGVAIIVQGSFGAGDLRGDLLALWMTTGMAIVMVIYRRFPSTPAAGPAALSSLALLPPALLFGAPFVVPWGEFAAMAAFGLIFAIASVTLAEGVKRIPAAETALLSALETPLAPVFGWMFFAEIPPIATFFGGGLILVAVIGTQVFAPKKQMATTDG
jgi:drug/metabolite transporter (DMT)-like permease